MSIEKIDPAVVKAVEEFARGRIIPQPSDKQILRAFPMIKSRSTISRILREARKRLETELTQMRQSNE